jgi:hypothetical protein
VDEIGTKGGALMTNIQRATDRATRQVGNGFSECDCCGKPLAWGRTVWLEYDQRIEAFHDYELGVPEAESLGLFPFGQSCATKLLREAREAARNAGVFLGRRRISKVAQAERRMAARQN